MQTEVRRKLFTVDEFYQMGEAGVFARDARLELIDGEIIEMSPIGDPHVMCVIRANSAFSILVVQRKALVSIQNPVRLNLRSLPQPDVLVLKPRADFYPSGCTPADVLLLIEVSDSSLRYDRNVKIPLYAASGIPEVWIEDLQKNQLLVYRDPAASGYQTCRTLGHGESVSPLAFPDLVVSVADLIG